MSKIEEIRKIATEVRQAIDQLKSENKIESYCLPFNEFPDGCCGDMSIVLTTHLENLGYGVADFICGSYFDEDKEITFHHAWIKLNGICIDITADQFTNENYEKVLVEYEQNYKPMAKFIPEITPPWQIRIDRDEQRAIYKLIKNLLNGTKS